MYRQADRALDPQALERGHHPGRAEGHPPAAEAEGEVVGTGANGATRDLTKTLLGRFGQSNSKPYCEGTHRRIGFTDPVPDA